ncbi:hypothetical protein LGK97_14795 [Clostridium sp. CS001]|uniref:hypothetical protein n=1 Tax=Clostridium sp. CS001 TaxID=2880648 RepID=UPI001CF4484E|nr:hypothetical protein [Clostridium sp. CS001]MCB2291003.1 hypothetical protein [Clostridium sp. CS001]
MMNKQSTIEFLIQKEKDIINKYRGLANVTKSKGQMLLCEDLSSKHSLHIMMLEKHLER